MKTPREIADEAMLSFTVTDGDVEEHSADYIREQIRAAIYIDRAQRADDMETLIDAAASYATELTDYIIPGSEQADDEDSAESQAEERDKIQVAIGRYLDEKEGE